MRRLAALCPHDTIGAEQIAAELVETTPTPAEAPAMAGPEPLVRAVERHIRDFLASHDNGVTPTDIYDRVIAEVERPLIRLTLAATRGNQIKAAAMLGLNRNTLRKKIRDPRHSGGARADVNVAPPPASLRPEQPHEPPREAEVSRARTLVLASR